MKKIIFWSVFVWTIGCAGVEESSEKVCGGNSTTCMDYEGRSMVIFNDLLGGHQDCKNKSDCSMKEFILNCENESSFSTCPAAVALHRASALERAWHEGAAGLCAEMRDCNMKCIARASCISPENDSVECVAGRCVAE